MTSIDTSIVNSIRPLRETIPETSLDKIINNFYTDLEKQMPTVNKLYYMLQDANNKSKVDPLPSVPNYSDINNRIIVIKYFLNDYVKVKNDFLEVMDIVINTNWVINNTRPGRPIDNILNLLNLTYTDSYRLLNNLVYFYSENLEILKTDLDKIR